LFYQEKQGKIAAEAAARWADNILILQSFFHGRLQGTMTREQINAEFGIDEDELMN
jgi:hypothetical protein